MMFIFSTRRIRAWLIGLFVTAINRSAHAEDRHAAIQWLLQSREILASNLSGSKKLKSLYAQISTRAAVVTIAKSISEGVRYRASTLSWPARITLLITLLATPIVGGHGVGLAAFGSAIGLPVLLLVFLGTAGITSIIETVVTQPLSRPQIIAIVEEILRSQAARQAGAAFKEAMREEASAPAAQMMPDDETEIRRKLLVIDPFEFERHVMSFFEKAGLKAVVTPRSNDFGMDGYATHPDGLIVVQCKRYASDNKVGRETIQTFKTVIGDQGAFRGYIVTTSSFTGGATVYVETVPSIVLVDMDLLVRWHKEGLKI